jgi:hypothetical protein
VRAVFVSRLAVKYPLHDVMRLPLAYTGALQYQLERVLKFVWALLCGDSLGCFWHRRRDIFVNPAKDNESVAFDDSDYYSSSDEDDPLVEAEQVPADVPVKEKDRQQWLERMLEWAPDRDEDRVVYGLPPRETGEFHVRRCRRRLGARTETAAGLVSRRHLSSRKHSSKHQGDNATELYEEQMANLKAELRKKSIKVGCSRVLSWL